MTPDRRVPKKSKYFLHLLILTCFNNYGLILFILLGYFIFKIKVHEILWLIAEKNIIESTPHLEHFRYSPFSAMVRKSNFFVIKKALPRI